MEATTIYINAGFINDGGYTDWVNSNKFCASPWLKKYGPPEVLVNELLLATH